MATQMIVPIFGESIQTATLARWNKKVGDAVKRGDEIAEVETDKATMALESPTDGVLLEILLPEGTQVQTGDLLAWIGQPGEIAKDTPLSHPAVQNGNLAPQISVQHLPDSTKSHGRISPAARKMAKSQGISLNQLQPEKPGLRIMTDDVQRFITRQQTQPSAKPEPSASERLSGRLVTLSANRRLTGARMLASVQQIPQFSVTVEADASKLLSSTGGRNRDSYSEDKITFTALLVFLTNRALQKNPNINARFTDDGLFIYDHVHMAVAVNTPRGLVAPVLTSVDCLSLPEVASQLNRLVQTARAGKLNQSDLEGGTFTLSNLGPQGIIHFNPIINPPQAATLGVASARPVVLPTIDGGLRHVKSMALTLTADHRVLDGADVANFLNDLRHEVEIFGER